MKKSYVIIRDLITFTHIKSMGQQMEFGVVWEFSVFEKA